MHLVTDLRASRYLSTSIPAPSRHILPPSCHILPPSFHHAPCQTASMCAGAGVAAGQLAVPSPGGRRRLRRHGTCAVRRLLFTVVQGHPTSCTRGWDCIDASRTCVPLASLRRPACGLDGMSFQPQWRSRRLRTYISACLSCCRFSSDSDDERSHSPPRGSRCALLGRSSLFTGTSHIITQTDARTTTLASTVST